VRGGAGSAFVASNSADRRHRPHATSISTEVDWPLAPWFDKPIYLAGVVLSQMARRGEIGGLPAGIERQRDDGRVVTKTPCRGEHNEA
jgi:hypothetical protein